MECAALAHSIFYIQKNNSTMRIWLIVNLSEVVIKSYNTAY